ncbi:TPA: molybdate ABC transporter substrate-binding protein [Aeromonas hydrophila]|uniref:molybdate ABC transporter substrate-binding protein n=1 Tax=Aeromonas hydrophila TaxID=644 RepID=UPI0005CF607B|nr:molybdate ABC transporter substrate-binding protein [Aeromonas hydrophila]AJQ55257.1 molybdate ABC transporter substrate-binding protein [Aeromonas hydrophila]HAU4883961.1 molybdate ABC transporter substrate-binding protein [Aeromonas hydrophila]
MKPLLSVVIAGVCASALQAGAVQADEVKVAVAANFKGTIERIGKEFTAKTGHTLAISSAATGVLYTQISHGAPFDLFLSADVKTPQKLEQEGKGSERFTYAIGQLGLWQQGGPAPDEATLRSWKGNLAIANPKTAPYGTAAMATLDHLKIDPKQYRLLTGSNIGQTWQFVDTGNAELGFVAWANLVEAGKTGEAWAVPADFYPPIEQQGLVLKKGAAVEALVAWIKGPGQAQIKAAGYALPH